MTPYGSRGRREAHRTTLLPRSAPEASDEAGSGTGPIGPRFPTRHSWPTGESSVENEPTGQISCVQPVLRSDRWK